MLTELLDPTKEVVKTVPRETDSLLSRLLNVQSNLRPLTKSGHRMDYSGKTVEFSYVPHDVVVSEIRQLCNQQRILVTSEQNELTITWETENNAQGKARNVCLVQAQEQIRFRSPDFPEQQETIVGRAAARGFDVTAVGVARSYATKYALLKYFLAEQGQEADAEESGERVSVQPPKPKYAQPSPSSGLRNESRPPVAVPQATNKPAGEVKPNIGKTGQAATPEILSNAWNHILTHGWHQDGSISQAQRNRLIAVASANGWSEEEVEHQIATNLKINPLEIPYGEPYKNVTNLFAKYRPPARS